MIKHIKTEISIDDTPEKVWAILVGFEDYLQWNPFIKSLEDEVKPGNRIKVRIAPPDAKEMPFEPAVINEKPAMEISWIGRLWVKGLFDGSIDLCLLIMETGQLHWSTVKDLWGFWYRFWQSNWRIMPKRGFQAMNTKLKELAEN